MVLIGHWRSLVEDSSMGKLHKPVDNKREKVKLPSKNVNQIRVLSVNELDGNNWRGIPGV
jgi:hypothetical protein